MFYINTQHGFVVHTNKGHKFSPDCRDARPFADWHEADEFAKNRFGDQYFAILGIGHLPDAKAATSHLFDIGDKVRVVRGAFRERPPPEVLEVLKQEGVITFVSRTLENQYIYSVELDDITGYSIYVDFRYIERVQ